MAAVARPLPHRGPPSPGAARHAARSGRRTIESGRDWRPRADHRLLPDWERVRCRRSATPCTSGPWTASHRDGRPRLRTWPPCGPRPDLLLVLPPCCTTSARAGPAPPVRGEIIGPGRGRPHRLRPRGRGGALHPRTPPPAAHRQPRPGGTWRTRRPSARVARGRRVQGHLELLHALTRGRRWHRARGPGLLAWIPVATWSSGSPPCSPETPRGAEAAAPTAEQERPRHRAAAHRRPVLALRAQTERLPRRKPPAIPDPWARTADRRTRPARVLPAVPVPRDAPPDRGTAELRALTSRRRRGWC